MCGTTTLLPHMLSYRAPDQFKLFLSLSHTKCVLNVPYLAAFPYSDICISNS